MSELPTPRELLIALHADPRLNRRRLGRLAGEVIGWARGRPQAPPPATLPAAAPPATLPALLALLVQIGARGETKAAPAPPPAWSTPGGAVAAAAAEMAAAAAAGARMITVLDPEYPEILAEMALPPPVLAVRGRLPPGPAVAIVGARHADGYGLEVAAHFARCLAAAGVAIVSGMAQGIDEAAHQGALAMPLGRTVAVLGCGVGFDYPRGHARQAAAIASRGALVSEFPCGARPQPWHFPVRNRTIAGLAAVTLVVQATPRSGSLDTARHAGRLGRPVFAVPGPVFAPLSWGPHALLRGGALLAGHPQDLCDALSSMAATRPHIAGIAADATAVGDSTAAANADSAVEADAGPPVEADGDSVGKADGDSVGKAAGISSAAAAPGSPAMPPATRVTAVSAVTALSTVGAAGVPAVLAALRRRAVYSAEQVAAATGLAPGMVLAALLELEIEGSIERLHGSAWRLARTRRRRAARAVARAP